MENHYQWMFVAGNMICKWAMFQFAMLVITRRYNKKLKDELLSIQIWEILPRELEKKGTSHQGKPPRVSVIWMGSNDETWDDMDYVI